VGKGLEKMVNEVQVAEFKCMGWGEVYGMGRMGRGEWDGVNGEG
jgi:hypothetical protein